MKALAPARVREVRIHPDTGTAEVIVPDFQLSLAIGKEGQNARLAARLIGLARRHQERDPAPGRGVGRRRRVRRGRVGQERVGRAGVAARRGRRDDLGRRGGVRVARPERGAGTRRRRWCRRGWCCGRRSTPRRPQPRRRRRTRRQPRTRPRRPRRKRSRRRRRRRPPKSSRKGADGSPSAPVSAVAGAPTLRPWCVSPGIRAVRSGWGRDRAGERGCAVGPPSPASTRRFAAGHWPGHCDPSCRAGSRKHFVRNCRN